jgi:hypothetical protein
MESLLLAEMRRLDDPDRLWNQPTDGRPAVDDGSNLPNSKAPNSKASDSPAKTKIKNKNKKAT